MKRELRKQRDEQIIKLRQEKRSMNEISEMLGLTFGIVAYVCKQNNLGGVLSDRKAGLPKQKRIQKYSDEQAREMVYSKTKGAYEYVGGYTGSDGTARIRCVKCNAVVTRACVSIRHGDLKCQECERRERETKKQREKAKLEEERRVKRIKAFKCVQSHIKTCKWCGNAFVAISGRNVYCSEVCMIKARNSAHKDRRLRIINSRIVDDDITLEKLYERDKGKCYLCGCVCDWNDYIIRSDNTFIALGKYPSIEHVKPLSKGGLHSWKNIRLACRDCNSKKGDKLSLPIAKEA